MPKRPGDLETGRLSTHAWGLKKEHRDTSLLHGFPTPKRPEAVLPAAGQARPVFGAASDDLLRGAARSGKASLDGGNEGKPS